MTRTRHDAAAVAIYAPLLHGPAGRASIDDQVRRCRAFADTRALPVAGVFKDAAESGAHLERADLQRLLTEATGWALSVANHGLEFLPARWLSAAAKDRFALAHQT
jgi:Resolvase, N terminal domain